MSSMAQEIKPIAATERKVSFLRTIQAVAWSFVGLRSGKEFEKDTQQLNPIHVVIAGFAGVALFIGALVLIVNWVVKTA
jgi:Protein of unknown function (DUF2970)